MKILNVNSSLDARVGGGTAERTFQMSRFLAKQSNNRCIILTLNIGLDASRIKAVSPATVVALPCLWKRFYVPQGGWEIIKKLVAEADVIHLMGHWSVLNALVYWAARSADKPYVVCPAGALPIFGRSSRLKKIYNTLIGNKIIRNAAAWIAVTEGELPHFEEYGIQTAKISVIPNGVDENDFPPANRQEFLARYDLPDVPFILFMGRLNLIKGPDLLLQGFIQAYAKIADFHLVYAGPDGGMQSELISAAKRAGISSHVHFLGYVSGVDKSAVYRNAELLVVPSRQEAMSIVAIEAAICGTPVMLTDQCGFSDIQLVDRHLEVAATSQGIAQGLSELLGDRNVLKHIAPIWEEFVRQRYSWKVIVLKYSELYKRIILTRRIK